MSDAIPRVFISYSWSSFDRVLELAERLVNDGVDVVLDKWELKEGQDKYAFMERCVTDDSITKVLMICDKFYAEKANNREGGVGDETMVISPEVYAKATETKYIPIIFERDENGKEYTPAYLKARIYFDLSSDDNFEKNYERLLRNLHNKPEHSKPPLGKMPEYLNEETVSFTPIRAAIKQVQSSDGKNQAKQNFLFRRFSDDFIKALVELAPIYDNNFDDNLLKQIDASKPLRDLFFDCVEVLILDGQDASSVLGEFFERTYNAVISVGGRNSYRESEFEFGLFLVWEMFIGTTAIFLHYECYSMIRSLLNQTFFLNDSPVSMNQVPCNYVYLRPSFSHIDNHIKRKKGMQLLTLAGDIAAKREKLPILKTQAIANADVILYQLSDIYNIKMNSDWAWFPMLYTYMGNSFYSGHQQIWRKMVSKQHCESLYPLFGVTSTEQLIEAVSRNKPNRDYSYHNGSSHAPSVLYSIKIENIATLP